ncbi:MULTISPECIES: CoA-disulfide reductase [unclassified Psychrobacillus]|uniref:CoA-disulfide reductase n=1 Tax=unclassified Psychrobacillus TaxID=2636677 RepID=UPI00146D46D0|nr:CoA-disulfide reductase [Psychrobacillus sp. BL-248-WT-3]NME04642.1 CoA-disulfide reductase [Psychrobacillus sp. BL-248-WT-3]
MHYVIIGGDAAGMSAAMEIFRNDSTAEITTLEKGNIYSYGQCGLPYVVGQKIFSTTDVIARSVEMFRTKYKIDAKIGHEVTDVNPLNKTVAGNVLVTGERFEVKYDRLLVATGASSIVPDWGGTQLDGIHTFKTIPQTEALIAELKDVNHVTIIGGGYIGLEMAENIREIGKKVRVIQRGDRLMPILDPEMSDILLQKAKEKHVEVKLNEEVKSFTGNTRVQEVVTDKGTYSTDLVLIAIGIKPATNFLKETGIETLENGAIIVNEYLETSIPDIYAAGDCATHFNRLKQKNDYIPLGTTANKQGRLAGFNMIGEKIPFKGIVGTSIMKFFELSIGRTGLSEEEVKGLDIPFDTSTIEASDIAGYYPGKELMQIKLLYRKEDQLLLGGQIVGGHGVDKRTDVLATALYHGMTLPDLLDLDLSYAPPFNGVWDPLQQLAKRNFDKNK